MDGTPGYSSTLPFASKGWEKAVDYTAFSALDFNSPGASDSYVSKGSKTKCDNVDWPISLKDGSSLVLGLGRTSSSCTSICSGKEMDEQSSIDVNLSINLNNIPSGAFKAVKARRPDLDLQLSLSTGSAESDVTTFTQGLIHYQNFPDQPVLAPVARLVDEGSTSSRWKKGSLVPPLNNQLEIPCPVPPTIPPTPLATPSFADIASNTVIKPQQRKCNVKTCQFQGCMRGARGASGLCIAHGGGRRCQRTGCQKGAEGKTIFCKAHGGGRRCQHLGCTKSAEGRTDYCIAHGGGRRCSHDGCTRAARGKSGLCIRHGGGKRCKVENCTKSAEGISGLCISHGGGRRCQYPECTKGAQGSTMFCKAHGGGKRCTFLGCTKGAEGSTPFCKGHGGGKRCTSQGCTKSVHGGTLFCVGHGGGKRCAMIGCTKSARGRTDYCVRHGGGKRCKFQGCPKSAQGSTDFCKAHGGGKRCSWEGAVACDKFARGKSGLCAAHNAQCSNSTTQCSNSSISTHMTNTFAAGADISYAGVANDHGITSIGSIGFMNQLISPPITARGGFSLPEGRVHGGNLMAMLGGTTFGTSNGTRDGCEMELGESFNGCRWWV